MANEENVIDLGVWNVPTSWDEVTLKQYQEIERYYEDKDKDFMRYGKTFLQLFFIK